MTGDTIAAIATAMSASGIGIIRISGDDSMEIISKVYRSKGGKKQIKKKPKAIRFIMDLSMTTIQ